MSDQLRLDRQLPALLEDLYLGGTPDYRDQALAAVARTRQRPAWSFPQRWLPMTDIATRPATVPRFPLRTVVVLALLAALAVAAIASIGSRQPRELPPPFGPARNGLVIFSRGGDVYTGDHASGQSRALLAGPEIDRAPLVSPDGTRILFRRAPAGSDRDAHALAMVNVDGTGLRIIAPSVSENDRFLWSPDGSFLLVNIDMDGRLLRYDLAGGPPKVLGPLGGLQPEAFRPPAGDLVLIEAASAGRVLQAMRPDGTGVTTIYEIPTAELRDGCDFGSIRWSPDGTRIALLRAPLDGSEGCRVVVMDADGSNARQLTSTPGNWTETDLQWSPDGTQIAFDRWQQLGSGQWIVHPIGVVSANGGEVRPIGPTTAPEGAAFTWSPDGTTIISLAGAALGVGPVDLEKPANPVLIDVATGAHREGSWEMSSWPAWQRLAPQGP